MGFVDFVSIMPILHVLHDYTSFLYNFWVVFYISCS